MNVLLSALEGFMETLPPLLMIPLTLRHSSDLQAKENKSGSVFNDEHVFHIPYCD